MWPGDTARPSVSAPGLGPSVPLPQYAVEPALAETLGTVRHRVAGTRLGLLTPGVESAEKARAEFVGQVDDYLLPRLRQLDAPLLAVVGGSTGAARFSGITAIVSPAGGRPSRTASSTPRCARPVTRRPSATSW